MATIKFRRVFTISASAGETGQKTWEADDNYTIKYILMIDQDGYSLEKFRVTVSIDNDYITEDEVSASVFGSERLTAWPIDKPIKQAQKFIVSYENNDSTTHNVDVVLVLES